MTDTDLIREMTEALEWYADEARALAKHLPSGTHTQAVIACLTVLSLDGGGRAYGGLLTAARERLAREDTQPAAVSAQGVTKIVPDFRWDAEALCHVPNLLIEFEPVPCNRGNDAKGWKDRDALAAALAAQPAYEPAEPVAWMDLEDMKTLDEDGWCVVRRDRCDPGADHSADVPLYAAPPAKPLTEEIHKCAAGTLGTERVEAQNLSDMPTAMIGAWSCIRSSTDGAGNSQAVQFTGETNDA